MSPANHLRVTKFVHKAGIGTVFTLALGLLVKANAAVDERLDEKYDKQIEREKQKAQNPYNR